MVNQLQEERDALMCATGQSPSKNPRSREEPVFATDTEVQWMQDPTDAKTQWMRERQAELAEATVQGAHREVFQLTQEMAEATSHWLQRAMLQPSMVGTVVSA